MTRRMLIALAALSLLAGLVLLTLEVTAGSTLAFDEAVLRSIAQWRAQRGAAGAALDNAMRDLTALGSTAVLTLVTLAGVGWLLMRRERAGALVLLAAVLSGWAVERAMKLLVGRARPQIFEHGDFVVVPSFPSGHATMSMVVYLTLGIVAAAHAGARLRRYWLAVGGLVGLAVGVSRVYLGVHWPTDVLAGWAIGAGWALGAGGVVALLARRRPPRPDERVV